MYGTFTRNIIQNNQPDYKQFDYFVLRMLTDALPISPQPILANSTFVDFLENYSNLQELQNKGNYKALITVTHDGVTQNLYPNETDQYSKVTTFWQRPYVIRLSLFASPENNELIKVLQRELLDLLVYNEQEYIETSTSLKCNTNANRILENFITFNGEDPNKPNFITFTTTILFKIYK